jgi:hypothetical protein
MVIKLTNSDLSVFLNIKNWAPYESYIVECLAHFHLSSLTSTVKPDLNSTVNLSS